MFRSALSPLFLFLFLCLAACATRPKNGYDLNRIPAAPDYSLDENWAALPWREDVADSLPNPQLKDVQPEAAADVFFLHPTTYTHKRGFDGWNGPVDNPRLNQRTDGGTILYQASIFNGVGKVYAPRYRQAHLHAYFTKKNRVAARRAFDLAYEDVRRAFQYYLDHHNNGRPIVLATHSQGTTHGIRLVKEFFDGKPLRDQLVAAYLVGIPVRRDTFRQVPPCETPLQTGCFCSWRTFKKGYEPGNLPMGPEIAVTNPLIWKPGEEPVPKSENLGGVLRDFNVILPNLASAQIYNGVLWTEKPKFPWSFLFTRRNYHIADYNLYYLNVRRNAQDRVAAYLETAR